MLATNKPSKYRNTEMTDIELEMKLNRAKNLADPRQTSLLRAYSALLKHAHNNLRNKHGVRSALAGSHASLFTF